MDFNKFVNELKENIKLYLPENYENAEVALIEYQKLNEAYTGLTVRKDGQAIAPAINLNNLYDFYQTHPYISMSTMFQEVAGVITDATVPVDPVNVYDILKYENVKDKLFIRVSSAEKNKEMLSDVPHQMKEDLAITYHIVIAKDRDGLSTMLVTNDLMEKYGVTPEQLHEDAMKSCSKVMKPQIYSMGSKLSEMVEKISMMLSPQEKEAMRQMVEDMPFKDTFIIMTNDQSVDGAGVIFYPEVMENMGYMLDSNFFILPSSVHETLILIDDGDFDVEGLKEMVTEINATQVLPQDRLTDEVYHYDTKDHVFEKADRFVERQKEKAAQAVKAEKTGKEQTEQKLKAKKHDMEL